MPLTDRLAIHTLHSSKYWFTCPNIPCLSFSMPDKGAVMGPFPAPGPPHVPVWLPRQSAARYRQGPAWSL